MPRVSRFLVVVFVFLALTSSGLADQRVPVDGTNGAVFVKAIIRAVDASISEEPGGKGKKTPAPPFKILYQFKSDSGDPETTVGGESWIRLGTGPSNVVGWIEKKNVELWNTRALLYPRAQTIKPDCPFQVFKDVNLKTLIGDQHGISGSQIAICPILLPPKDESDPIYEIVFFAAKATSATGTGTSVSSDPSAVLEDLTQDIVYVIDTTKSMTALLDGTKRIAELSAKQISGGGSGGFSELKGKVRFGLVEYQDNTPGLFVSKVTVPLTSDLNSFVSSLAPVHVAPEGSEETKEDVLGGLKTAITDPKVGWDSNSLKHIILLGDASAHLDGPKNTTGLNIKQVVDLARPQGGGSETTRLLSTITLHSVRAINPDDPSDHEECKKQFATISKNNGQENGFNADVEPGDAKDVEKTVNELVDLMRKSYEAMQKIIGAKKGHTPISSVPSDPKAGAFERKVWTLYGLTQAEEKEEVFRGFAQERNQDGKTVADSRLLVQFDEIKRLSGNLKFVYDGFSTFADDPEGRKDVNRLLLSLQVLAASQGVGDFVSTSKLVEVVSSLPLKSDVLNKTIDDIAIMTNEDFADFLKSIEASRQRADTLLDKTDNWNALIGDDANNSDKFSFLRIDELP